MDGEQKGEWVYKKFTQYVKYGQDLSLDWS